MSKTLSSKSIVRDFLLEREENFEIASKIDINFLEIKIEMAEEFVVELIEYLKSNVPSKLGAAWTVITRKERPSSKFFGIILIHSDWSRANIVVNPLFQFGSPNCNSLQIGIAKLDEKIRLPSNDIKETLDRRYKRGKNNSWWPYYVVPSYCHLTRNSDTTRKIYFHKKEMVKEIGNEFITMTTIVKDILIEMNS